MRTPQWRFVEWTRRGEKPVWELYDSTRDAQNDQNLADRPEHAQLLAALSARLRERFPVQDFRDPGATPPAKATRKQSKQD
jgi:hypothetical protein